jgi:hypothetical protein
MKANVNNKAKVKLTPYGLKVLSESWYGIIESEISYQTDGVVFDSQLWVIMNIFGKELYNGQIKGVFIGNRIEIEPDDE